MVQKLQKIALQRFIEQARKYLEDLRSWGEEQILYSLSDDSENSAFFRLMSYGDEILVEELKGNRAYLQEEIEKIRKHYEEVVQLEGNNELTEIDYYKVLSEFGIRELWKQDEKFLGLLQDVAEKIEEQNYKFIAEKVIERFLKDRLQCFFSSFFFSCCLDLKDVLIENLAEEFIKKISQTIFYFWTDFSASFEEWQKTKKEMILYFKDFFVEEIKRNSDRVWKWHSFLEEVVLSFRYILDLILSWREAESLGILDFWEFKKFFRDLFFRIEEIKKEKKKLLSAGFSFSFCFEKKEERNPTWKEGKETQYCGLYKIIETIIIEKKDKLLGVWQKEKGIKIELKDTGTKSEKQTPISSKNSSDKSKFPFVVVIAGFFVVLLVVVFLCFFIKYNLKKKKNKL